MIMNPLISLGGSSLTSLLAFSAAPLAHLRPLDIAVIVIYFGMVVWIGFYLKGKSKEALIKSSTRTMLASNG